MQHTETRLHRDGALRKNVQRTPVFSKSSGFTLIEFMVVVAVIGILLQLVSPSFVTMTQGSRVSTKINALAGDMKYARAQAVMTGLPVSICASSDGASCASTDKTNWAVGWVVFTDPSGNKAVDTGDTILKKQTAWPGSDTYVADNSTNAIAYNRDGFAIGLSGTVTWTLHTSPVNNKASRCIALNTVGRVQVITPGNGNCT